MIKLLKIHNISKRDDLSGRKILRDKSIFTLIPRINTIFRQRRNQALARSLSEKGNSFNLTISLPHLSYFAHKSTKLFRWVAASSLGRPENGSFMTRFSKAALISQDLASVRGAIGLLRKSLLLVLVKSHNLVLSWAIATSKQTNTQANEKQTGKKRQIEREDREREGE